MFYSYLLWNFAFELFCLGFSNHNDINYDITKLFMGVVKVISGVMISNSN